jgi:hypothetical protein
MTAKVWRGLFAIVNPKIKGFSALLPHRTDAAVARYPSWKAFG